MEKKDNLKQQGVHVSDVQRISVRRDGEQKLTNTYILTFSSPVLSTSIKTGFQIVKVDVYVPNPLRYFKCQRNCHHIKKCPDQETFSKFAHQRPYHDSSTCSNPPHCNSCQSPHSTFSKECPAWMEEKPISSIKYNNNVCFPKSGKLFERRKKTFSSPSYVDVVAGLLSENSYGKYDNSVFGCIFTSRKLIEKHKKDTFCGMKISSENCKRYTKSLFAVRLFLNM